MNVSAFRSGKDEAAPPWERRGPPPPEGDLLHDLGQGRLTDPPGWNPGYIRSYHDGRGCSRGPDISGVPPDSGAETAFPVLHGPANARMAQRHPDAESTRARPFLRFSSLRGKQGGCTATIAARQAGSSLAGRTLRRAYPAAAASSRLDQPSRSSGDFGFWLVSLLLIGTKADQPIPRHPQGHSLASTRSQSDQPRTSAADRVDDQQNAQCLHAASCLVIPSPGGDHLPTSPRPGQPAAELANCKRGGMEPGFPRPSLSG